jgi:uncharacterized protein
MPASSINAKGYQGVGIGLRSIHYQTILADRPDVPWFEALTDNYMNEGGYPLHYLEKIRAHYPITFHGVGLSLGGHDPLDIDYIRRLKDLRSRFEPIHFSDHLCWTSHNGRHSNDLLPMPYTQDAVRHIAERIDAVQNILGEKILVENVSSYLNYKMSDRSEAEFFAEVANESDCLILCDINNIYVSAKNHGFDAVDYLNLMPSNRITELHLAGYEDQGEYLLDTHGEAVHEPVWSLYEKALGLFGTIPTLLEWDTNIPEFSVLMQEQRRAKSYWPQKGTSA